MQDEDKKYIIVIRDSNEFYVGNEQLSPQVPHYRSIFSVVI